MKKQYPSLSQFKEQIDFYEGLHEQLKHIKNVETVQVRERTTYFQLYDPLHYIVPFCQQHEVKQESML